MSCSRAFLSSKVFLKSDLSYLHQIYTRLVAFIFSRLEYCNAPYMGISPISRHRLLLVQNAAARIQQAQNCMNTLLLCQLTLATNFFQIDFKMLLLMFKALDGLAPTLVLLLLRSLSTWLW